MILKYAKLDLNNPGDEETAMAVMNEIFKKTLAYKENTLFVCDDSLALIETVYDNMEGKHIATKDDRSITFDNGATLYQYTAGNDDCFIPPTDNTVFLSASHIKELNWKHISHIDSKINDRDNHTVYILDDMTGGNRTVEDLRDNLLCGAAGWAGLWWKIKVFFKRLFRKK